MHPLIVHDQPARQSLRGLPPPADQPAVPRARGPAKTIVVTSSLPGEGKSTTAINLAITLADAGSRVALIDADLRRPSLAEYMGLEGEVGLTTVLIGQADLRDAIQPWGDSSLHVLPSGQIPPNPSELLGSLSMANLLEQLTNRYDIVLIDTPPLLPVTDAAILATITGGALVVAAADRLHRQQLTDGLGSLETVGARVLGCSTQPTPLQTDRHLHLRRTCRWIVEGSQGQEARRSRVRATADWCHTKRQTPCGVGRRVRTRPPGLTGDAFERAPS
jgi:succinoglycan biosynthesis transport protein ExoP